MSESGGNNGVQSYQSLKSSSQNETSERSQESAVTNEYVLGVAFWSFVGFLLLEAVFAIIAGSQSMLEDAEAMSVDALTYLFNMCAERIKYRPYSEKELALDPDVREYRRELVRLYLELVPPLISVVTLVIVTVCAIQDAWETLHQPDDVPEEDVDVNLMLGFSGANLLLDFVNVFCFARANQAFGLGEVKKESPTTKYSVRQSQNVVEMESLLQGGGANGDNSGAVEPGEDLFLNLNMCSAWTHVCADTMRSTAVLIAAAISFVFPDYLSGATADSMAAIVVSIIILVSLMPLLRGLYLTARKIIILSNDPNRPSM